MTEQTVLYEDKMWATVENTMADTRTRNAAHANIYAYKFKILTYTFVQQY